MKPRTLRLPFRREKNRLGLTKSALVSPRAERRAAKVGVLAGALCVGAAFGHGFGDDLIARALPEQARVGSLAVAGNVHTDATAIARAAGVGANTLLAEIEPADLARALETLPWVRSARATTLAPNRVVVAIDERVPVAVARLADGSRHLVDAGGVAFAPAPAETRGPELIGLDALPASGKADPALARGVALLEAWLAAKLPEARAVEVAGPSASELPVVVLAERSVRVLLGRGELAPKLARLQRTLGLNEPALARAVAIDLRFPGQGVLRFAAPCPARSAQQVLGGEDAAAGKDPAAAASVGGEELCHAKTT
jgi:cell division septal protein FtsQ